MPNVAIEAVILAPLLIVQILLFPFVATTMSSYWANATRDVTIRETASQMASTIQQLYLFLNRGEVSAGTTVHTSTFPNEIAAHAYTVIGSLKPSSEPNSGRILLLNLTLQDLGNSVTTQTSLGPNVSWKETSVFQSSSPTASIEVQKFANGTLLFSFG